MSAGKLLKRHLSQPAIEVEAPGGNLHLQLQLQLGKSKTEKANLTSCFHAGQKDQDQDQDVARSACRKCGNVHFIAEIYSCAETR